MHLKTLQDKQESRIGQMLFNQWDHFHQFMMDNPKIMNYMKYYLMWILQIKKVLELIHNIIVKKEIMLKVVAGILLYNIIFILIPFLHILKPLKIDLLTLHHLQLYQDLKVLKLKARIQIIERFQLVLHQNKTQKKMFKIIIPHVIYFYKLRFNSVMALLLLMKKIKILEQIVAQRMVTNIILLDSQCLIMKIWEIQIFISLINTSQEMEFKLIMSMMNGKI